MKSYLKFLSRNKLYTAIEAVGLVISIAFVILIGNYVWQQYSIAHENPIGDRVYAVGNDQYVALSYRPSLPWRLHSGRCFGRR